MKYLLAAVFNPCPNSKNISRPPSNNQCPDHLFSNLHASHPSVESPLIAQERRKQTFPSRRSPHLTSSHLFLFSFPFFPPSTFTFACCSNLTFSISLSLSSSSSSTFSASRSLSQPTHSLQSTIVRLQNLQAGMDMSIALSSNQLLVPQHRIFHSRR